jgi:ribosomal protein S18 acetylase RimI-like enzyme
LSAALDDSITANDWHDLRQSAAVNGQKMTRKRVKLDAVTENIVRNWCERLNLTDQDTDDLVAAWKQDPPTEGTFAVFSTVANRQPHDAMLSMARVIRAAKKEKATPEQLAAFRGEDCRIFFDGKAEPRPDGCFVVSAVLPSVGEVGWMELDAPNGLNEREILDIVVLPQFRRRGIGSALWQRAEQSGLSPAHSTWRTPEGDGFAQAVGGYMPENRYGDSDDSDDDYDEDF